MGRGTELINTGGRFQSSAVQPEVGADDLLWEAGASGTEWGQSRAPWPKGPPPVPETRVMATSGKHLALGSPEEGDRPWLCWRFPGRCFPAISAGRHSWKAPALGSPAAREGQVEGGRREPELSFPLPGFEKHAQPWLRVWELQSPAGVAEDKTWEWG